MAHEARDNMNRRARFEKLGSDAMPEGVNADVHAFRSFNPKFGHYPVDAVSDHVVRQVGPSVGIREQVSVRIRLVVFGEPILQVPSE